MISTLSHYLLVFFFNTCAIFFIESIFLRSFSLKLCSDFHPHVYDLSLIKFNFDVFVQAF